MSASTPTRSEPPPRVRHIDYRPYGAVRTAWLAKEREVLVSGPAGTGKTRGLLELVHLRALKHPGSRSLITRKVRVFLTQTALVCFNKEVRPELDGVIWRTTEQEYRYPNGSVVVVGGLDKEGQRVFSGQYDQVYVNEAIELSEADWENLTTRLRNGRMPRQQIIADTNPSFPTHWLKKRCEAGHCRLINSRHEDNPTLWDGASWTPHGLEYIATLDALTGPRKLRLRHGRWVQAEGVVYPQWDPEKHVIERASLPGGDVPVEWPRVWAVDFGFTNPFAWLECAIDGDGRLYVVRQIYHTRRTVAVHARRIRELTERSPPPVGIVCDGADAEGRATLEGELGYPTMAAAKTRTKKLGIQAVAERLKPAGDGRPRLFVLADSLDEADGELLDAKKPTRGEQEFDCYVWDPRPGFEEPVDRDNHFCDALRYLVYALDQPGEQAGERETVYRP